MNPHCPTRQSVRPSKCSDAAPVYGTTSKQVEITVEGMSAGEETAVITEESGEAKEAIEE